MFADGLAHVCHVAQDLISVELAYITTLTSRQKKQSGVPSHGPIPRMW